jgi:ElaB/YqjD/DUF883 family membrane-anchored ribosome-binding protein
MRRNRHYQFAMSSHSKSETSTTSPEELLANIQKLMDEVETVINHRPTATGNHESGNRLADLQDRLSGMADRVKGAYKTARRNVVNGAHQTDQTIRTHPYQSLAVALGLGVLVGALLRRSHEQD